MSRWTRATRWRSPVSSTRSSAHQSASVGTASAATSWSICSYSREETSRAPASARKRWRRSAVFASVTSSMMLTASVPPSSSSVALVRSQYSAAGPPLDAVGQQRRRVLARHQPLPRQVGLLHRCAVLARDDEAGRELAGLGRQQLLDRLGAEQRRRRGVGVDELPRLVVHGHGLRQHAEDALQPLPRAPQLGDQLGVGEAARGTLGQRLEERELLVGRRPRRGRDRARGCRAADRRPAAAG